MQIKSAVKTLGFFAVAPLVSVITMLICRALAGGLKHYVGPHDKMMNLISAGTAYLFASEAVAFAIGLPLWLLLRRLHLASLRLYAGMGGAIGLFTAGLVFVSGSAPY